MFFGRKKELEVLENLYKTNKFQMPVIYGRRRIGKTALIKEFVKNKEVIFYTAIEKSKMQNIDSFGKAVMEVIDKKNSSHRVTPHYNAIMLLHLYSISLPHAHKQWFWHNLNLFFRFRDQTQRRPAGKQSDYNPADDICWIVYSYIKPGKRNENRQNHGSAPVNRF